MNTSHDSRGLRERYDAATARIAPPLAIVDMDAFDANAAAMAAAARGLPIRVASKSVRCRALLERVLAMPGYAGVLAFSLAEANWLVENGVTGDAVVGYPTADHTALAALVADPRLAEAVTLMVDDVAQLDWIDHHQPAAGRPVLRVCIDLDASWRPFGGRAHVGVRRSPVHRPVDAVRLAKAIAARPGFRLVGVMSYEAQIAGVQQGEGMRAGVIRLMQRRSFTELRRRRGLAVTAIRRVAPLEFVNAGGTGSLSLTATDAAVTELTAGSGLYAPTLFDGYDSFRPRPAAAFAVSVVRRPGPGIATVHGGGWPASGEAGTSRLPTPWLPAGLRLTGMEAAGEVQTPLTGDAADSLHVGDRVWFRHAKAGELCERVDRLHLVRGDVVEAEAATYRGDGRAFL